MFQLYRAACGINAIGLCRTGSACRSINTHCSINKRRTTIRASFSSTLTSSPATAGCSRYNNAARCQLQPAAIGISSISSCVTTVAAVTAVTGFITHIIAAGSTAVATVASSAALRCTY